MPRRLTTEKFIERAKAVHGDRYDYSQVEYVNAYTKVTIICPEHGPFPQAPTHHLAGKGCGDCAGNRQRTTNSFIEEAIEVHGNRYDYSRVEYINNSSVVMIICPEHGPFPQRPNGHLQGRGCRVCAGVMPHTRETFVQKAKAVHGDRYDYSSVHYVSAHTDVIIICDEHGPFPKTPNSHLSKKSGCPDCAHNQPSTTESFIQKARTIHGDRYDYSQVEYVNNKTDITIICPEHGPFSQSPSNHLAGKVCYDCREPKPPLTTAEFIAKAEAVHADRYDYSFANYVDARTDVTIICSEHGLFPQNPSNHFAGKGCPDCAELGFNPSEPGVLYYIAVATDDGDTRYKIGITNRTVEERFFGPDLVRIRIIKTWRYAIGRVAKEREAEILKQYAGDKYYGPDILVSAGNTELFTHDILGLDNCDE